MRPAADPLVRSHSAWLVDTLHGFDAMQSAYVPRKRGNRVTNGGGEFARCARYAILDAMTIKRPRLWAGLALGAIWLVVALAVAGLGFANDSRTVVIGAHTTTVSPTFDGYATLDFGPVLPRFRVASDQPFDLGVNVDVGDTQAASLDDVIRRDAIIASQPDGEVRELKRALLDMAIDHGLRGVGAGIGAVVATVAIWEIVGRRRRVELGEAVRRSIDERERRPMLMAAGVVAVVAMAVAVAFVPGPEKAEPASGPAIWVPLPSLFPDQSLDPELNRIEVLTGGASRGGVQLIESAVTTYNKSLVFYRDLTERAAELGDRLRDPEEGDTVALMVADRHDNIGMDSVARAIADAGNASLVIDAGDDTSSGGSWERFSVNSLADAFEGFEVVVVGGNHDYGGAIVDAYEDQGFTVLAGEPETVEGITFLGDSDVRASGLVAGRTEFDETDEEQGRRLADVACESGDVSTLVVHGPTASVATAESGCVDLVLSGHAHRQIGPDTTYIEGRPTTSYTNGTTGGAAYAFALGSALRRPAEVTLITFHDGRPIGLQPVLFTTDGTISVRPWVPVGAGLADDDGIATDRSGIGRNRDVLRSERSNPRSAGR
jgi:predicted phosphodiesterase